MNQQQRNHPRQSFVTVASKMIFCVFVEMDTGELKKAEFNYKWDALKIYEIHTICSIYDFDALLGSSQIIHWILQSLIEMMCVNSFIPTLSKQIKSVLTFVCERGLHSPVWWGKYFNYYYHYYFTGWMRGRIAGSSSTATTTSMVWRGEVVVLLLLLFWLEEGKCPRMRCEGQQEGNSQASRWFKCSSFAALKPVHDFW